MSELRFQVGDSIPEVRLPEMTRERLQAYAEASLDKNPIHLDDDFARSVGLPGIIGHGMLSMSFLMQPVRTAFPADKFLLRKVKAKFRRPTRLGEKLVGGGKLKRVQEDGTLVLSVWVKNEEGESKTEGDVEVKPISA